MNRLNICVVGPGGVGGYFGAKLSRLHEDFVNVYFIARGAHLEAIKESGITLHSPQTGSFTCRPMGAADNFDQLPDMDVYFIAVKGYDLDDVALSISDRVRKDTVILAPLNGMDIHERLRTTIDSGVILPSCVYITSHVERPGVIRHAGNPGRLVFGEDRLYPGYIPERLMEVLSLANIDYSWEKDVESAIWGKYLFIASFALVTACYNKAMGEVIADNVMRGEIIDIMEEVRNIASRKNIYLRDDIIDATLDKAASFPYDTKSSLQRDIYNKKGRNELESLGGAIVRFGQKFEVDTSVTERLYGNVKEIAERSKIQD